MWNISSSQLVIHQVKCWPVKTLAALQRLPHQNTVRHFYFPFSARNPTQYSLVTPIPEETSPNPHLESLHYINSAVLQKHLHWQPLAIRGHKRFMWHMLSENLRLHRLRKLQILLLKPSKWLEKHNRLSEGLLNSKILTRLLSFTTALAVISTHRVLRKPFKMLDFCLWFPKLRCRQEGHIL